MSLRAADPGEGRVSLRARVYGATVGRSILAAVCSLILAIALGAVAAPSARAKTISVYPAFAPAGAAAPSRTLAPVRPVAPQGAGASSALAGAASPSGPGLGLGPGTDASAVSADGGGDPLATNGFGSILCRDVNIERGLSPAAQSNCSTSTFVAAAAPTENYALDVHIDGGVADPTGSVTAAFQQVAVAWPWTVLVWVVHALIIALEWCYSLDLLNGTTMSTIAGALEAAQAAVTQPWMAAVLAVAAVLALYHGLIRRRVAATLGDVLLMLAMMAGGLWIIVDPVGTIGSLGHLSNGASLGTLAAVTQGDPGDADRTLADGMRQIFSTEIQGPWCFLEFGDVDWCATPARLDPRLRAAAARIVASARTTPQTPSQRNSALLLSRAETNGGLFLALPANGPQRNAINDDRSLLRVLCASSDASNCQGPTAAQAQFRTASGTASRLGGMLLILLGASGMLALLVFIALRLFGAAVASLLYLLIAPLAVLAPALGDGGRAAFRAWATRLLGAVVAKLIYSVLLGTVLLMLRTLDELGSLGWWTQWLLVAGLWWTAFHHRHHLLSFGHSQEHGSGLGSGMRTAYALTFGSELGRRWRGDRKRTDLRENGHPRPPGGRQHPRPKPPGRPGGGAGRQSAAQGRRSGRSANEKRPRTDRRDPGVERQPSAKPQSASGARAPDPERQPSRGSGSAPSPSPGAPQSIGDTAGLLTPGRTANESSPPGPATARAAGPPNAGAGAASGELGQVRDRSEVALERLAIVRREREAAQAQGDSRRAALLEHQSRRLAEQAAGSSTASAARRSGGHPAGGAVTAPSTDSRQSRAHLERELDGRPPASVSHRSSGTSDPVRSPARGAPVDVDVQEGAPQGAPRSGGPSASENVVMRRERQFAAAHAASITDAGSVGHRAGHAPAPTPAPEDAG